jgi:hypothetical protein
MRTRNRYSGARHGDRPFFALYALILAFLCGAVLLACGDSTEGAGAVDETPGPRVPRDGGVGLRIDTGVETPPSGGEGPGPLGGTPEVPVGGGAPPPVGGDGEPEPSCDDASCGEGQVCYQDRCIEGTRCQLNEDCPAGRICIARICLPDPTGATLTAEPPALLFTFARLGDTIRRSTTLVNTGDVVLNVTSAAIAGPPVFALGADVPPFPIRLVPNQRVELPIDFTPDDEATERGLLTLVTDNPVAPNVEVILQSDRKVVGGQVPCLQIVPARADFGAVARGSTGERTVDLVSCGTVPVSVTAIRRGRSFLGELSPRFDLGNRPAFPLVLAPNERFTLELTYTPGRAGLEAGNWDVLSTDRDNPTQRIDVSALANPPPLAEIGLHIRVSWDNDLTDVDTHVLAPGGQMWTCDGDCYFSNPNPNWGDQARFEDDPFLDVDDVDGFGPENVNIQEPAPGTYRVFIHYWSDHGGTTPATTVEVLNFGQVVGRYGPEETPSVDDVWRVVEIDWPGPVLRAIGGVNNEPRGALCGGFNLP